MSRMLAPSRVTPMFTERAPLMLNDFGFSFTPFFFSLPMPSIKIF